MSSEAAACAGPDSEVDVSERRGTVAVAVDCPTCERAGAVAIVTVDDSAGSPGILRIDALTCPRGCEVDPSDPQVLRRTGLAE